MCNSLNNIYAMRLSCIAKFLEKGYICSLPYKDSAKYDFIADIDGKLYRIKYKDISNKSVKLSKNSKNINNDIDYFMADLNNNFYIIPVDEYLDFDCDYFSEKYKIEKFFQILKNKK